MNNNTTYKDSPLGKIPSDWEVKIMGEVATFINGKAYKQEELLSEGKYRVLRVGNFFTKGDWYYSDIEMEDDKYVFNGDLMYAWSASFGPKYWNDEKTVYHYHIWKVIPSDLITKQYLYSLLLFDTEKIFSAKQGGTMFHITKGDMEKRKLPLPPLPEQTRIAEVLSAWDRAISNVQATIEQVELRNKWLMQELLTGKRRLKGFSGEWKEYKLEYFIEEYNEKPKIGNNYEVFTSAKLGLMKQTDYYGDNRITNREDADYNVLPPNYLTYRSRSDDGLFTFNKNTLGITGLISGYYPVFTIKNGNLDFVLTYCNFFRQKLTKFSIGTSQLVLAMNALKKASFEFPSHEEQTAIAQVLQAAANEVQVLRSKLDKLKEQKKGLMQVLLTGKKRLVV
jgi:type I restriction enzyme S subunit